MKISKKHLNFITLLIGFSQIYAWATTYYLPATLVKILSIEMNESYTIVTGGFSWALLIGGLCAPKIGEWIELKGGRYPLVLGSVLMGLGLIVLSQTENFLLWYLAWTIVGLGMALGLFNAAFAALGRLFLQDSKKIIVRVTLISGFATLFWPITTYLIESVGWRTMLVIYAIPHLFVWAPLFYFTIPAKVPAHDKEAGSDSLVIPARVKIVFYLLASYAILRSVVGTVISVNILSMFQGIGLAAVTASLVASLIGPSQIVGRLLEMYVGRNFDPIKSSIFWTAVLPFAIFLLTLIGSSFSSIFSIAYGMSNGVLTITMGILPMILFGSKGYARMLGKLALPTLVAQSAAPLLAAPLIEHWASMKVFMLAGGLGFVSLMFLLLLSYYSKK